MFEGFEQVEVALPGATIRARTGGAGDALLLLHGYPQTHAMWHGIAGDLARSHRVVAADLRGYGASVAQDGDFTFRAMAAYEEAARDRRVVAGWCGDYRAAATTDLDHDRADLGRTSDIPCLVLWGRRGAVAHHLDPLDTWRSWFPNAEGHAMDAGHFLVEERPRETLQALTGHLERR